MQPVQPISQTTATTAPTLAYARFIQASKVAIETLKKMVQSFPKGAIKNLDLKQGVSALKNSVTIILELAAESFSRISGKRGAFSINVISNTLSGSLVLISIIKRIRKTGSALFKLNKIEAKLLLKRARLRRILKKNAESTEAIRLKYAIELLEGKRIKCLNQSLTVRKIPVKLIEVSAAFLALAYYIGMFARKIPVQTLTALESATTVLGCALGSIAVLFGTYEIFRGIQKSKDANKALKEIEKEQHNLLSSTPQTKIPEEFWNIGKKLRSTQLARDEIKQRRVFTRSVLRACAGGLVTVSGALAIAGAFTAGMAAIGIAIAGAVIGFIGLGISIGSYIKGRELKKQMQQQTVSEEEIDKLSEYILKLESLEQREEIAHLLGVNAADVKIASKDVLMHQFRKIAQKP